MCLSPLKINGTFSTIKEVNESTLNLLWTYICRKGRIKKFFTSFFFTKNYFPIYLKSKTIKIICILVCTYVLLLRNSHVRQTLGLGSQRLRTHITSNIVWGNYINTMLSPSITQKWCKDDLFSKKQKKTICFVAKKNPYDKHLIFCKNYIHRTFQCIHIDGPKITTTVFL